MTDVLSQQRLEVDGMPMHVSEFSRIPDVEACVREGEESASTTKLAGK